MYGDSRLPTYLKHLGLALYTEIRSAADKIGLIANFVFISIYICYANKTKQRYKILIKMQSLSLATDLVNSSSINEGFYDYFL